MSRVLITGASGFLGRFVPAQLLARGFEVHLSGSRSDPGDWPQCPYHQADLLTDGAARALIAAARPTHLLHLAWYVEPGKYWSSPKNLDWVSASLQLFRAFAESGGKRFVGAGTCVEYDWSLPILSPREMPLNPSTLYGSAKARLFQLLSAAAPESSISFAWGRVFFPFGPHEDPGRLMPQVIQGLLHGEEVALSAGTQVRDFIYAEDVATLFAELVSSSFEGAVDIGGGNGLSIREFVELVLRYLGPVELLRFGKRAEGNDTSPRMIADIASLQAAVGTPKLVGVEVGVERSVAWWRLQQQS